MKNLLILFCLLFLLGCNKDASPKSEMPINAFIIEKKLLAISNNVGSSLELGIQFSSTKNGKIIQVGAKMPELGIYTVSIWDDATSKVIRQKLVEQQVNGKLTTVNIESLAIEKDKKYSISINTEANKIVKPYFGADVPKNWPYTIGNILFHTSSYQEGFKYPSVKVDSRIYPNLDFTFIAD
jgi:hypothetical protein